MKYSTSMAVAAAALALSGCFSLPAGPAGPQGATGNTGATGYTGDKGNTGATGYTARLATQGPRVVLAPWAALAPPEPLAAQVQRAIQGPPAIRALLETRVPKVIPAQAVAL